MRKCEICEKGSIIRGSRKKLRGKYNPTTQKRKYPNLQNAVIGGKKVSACTECRRTAVKVVKPKPRRALSVTSVKK